MADLLLGREDELAAIERFLTAVAGTTGDGAGPATLSDGARPRLERARSGLASPAWPTALLIDGEARIGKTTLWNSALRLAQGRRDLTILLARATLAERDLAHAVLTDLLEPIGDDTSAILAGPQREALDAVRLPGPGPAGGDIDPRTIGMAVTETLRRAAADRPMVILVDDLQWVDGAPEAALGFALRRLDDDRVALIATLRLDPDRPASGLAGAIPAERRSDLHVRLEICNSPHDADCYEQRANPAGGCSDPGEQPSGTYDPACHQGENSRPEFERTEPEAEHSEAPDDRR